MGAVGAIALLGLFLTLAGLVAPSGEPVAPAALEADGGLGVVIRTPQHLARAANVEPAVEGLLARGVRRAWVQMKQDETDEFAAGTLFYSSRLAPVAPGYRDGRLGAFIEALSDGGVEVMAWMPLLHDEQAARAHPEWRSRHIAGDGSIEIQEDWLCPFNPAVVRYQASIAREIAARFPDLTGLYLDFLRYDDDFSCASPAALAELDRRAGWRARTGRSLAPIDIRRAASTQDDLWTEWTDMRAEKIAETADSIRDAVEEVRPGFRIGAFVLPFSSRDYEMNTQSGQDIERLARSGLDELVLMGYWDDWDLSPAWLRRSMDAAALQVGDQARLSVVLDGDMGVRRTRLTLEALGPWAASASWFNYGPWSATEFRRLARALEGNRRDGPMPRPEKVSVVIRVDTEPDYQPSYDAVHPAMIDALVGMFAAERVHATWITVGRLAELQPAAIARVAAAGHEIGSHTYDHDQLDSLAVADQIASIDRGLSVLGSMGYRVHGFGAPRNSITDEARDRLMEWDLEYDGSQAYDPLTSLIDVHYEADSRGRDTRILVMPFVMPNDYDARYAASLSADEMLAAWTERLDVVVASGEPVFILDVHQWAASQRENLDALRSFIRYAKACSVCRVETMRDAARNARRILDRYELPGPTSGEDRPGPTPALAPAQAEARP